MLFHSSLRKSLSRNFWTSLVVLISIVITITLIRTLGQASRGNVNPSEVFWVMGFGVISQLTTICTLSLFIAVVATFSRMYSDSEMAIWFSSGQGVGHFVKPLLRSTWPVLLVVSLLALVVWPWSNQQVHELKERFEKRSDIERVSPGQFQESAKGQRVFFIDKDSPDNRFGRHVFITSVEGTQESVTTAQQGRIEVTGSDKFLILDKGQQWLTDSATGETRLTQFERYELLIDEGLGLVVEAVSSQRTSTWDLLLNLNPASRGELSWRVGLVVAGFNLMLVALALSAVNPRAGRSHHLALALLIFVSYNNMLNVGQSWISTGRMDAATFMLGLHGGFFLLAALWLTVLHFNLSWRALLPHRPGPRKGLA